LICLIARTANRTSRNLTVADVHELLYGTGEAAVARAPGECSVAERACAGGKYCVHRGAPTPVSREAAWHWRHFAAPLPTNFTPVPGRAAVQALLDARVHPRVWAACGADAERLALLGFTLDDLVRGTNTPLEHVVAGLELDWPRLETLHFTASLFAHPRHYPVVVLVAVGATAARLMRATPDLRYKHLATYLSHEEMRLLGFDAPMLIHLGMRDADVFTALRHEHVRARGCGWWVRAMRFNRALLKRTFPRKTVPLMSAEDRVLHATLALAVRGDTDV